MLYRLAALSCLFLPAAPIAIAQDASFSGAGTTPLPLRNVAIEVRQSLTNASAGQGVGLNGAQATVAQQSANTTAQILVLNGRPARMRVTTDAPVRLYQAVLLQGQWRIVAGTLWQEAGTELWVTPRWTGAAELELELSTRQSQTPDKARSGVSSRASSTIVVPLDTWTTVAESDAATSQSQSTLTGAVKRDTTTRNEVQVRVTVR